MSASGKHIAFRLLALSLGLVIAMALGEIIARLAGFHPWKPEPFDIEVTPGGQFFKTHKLLGYTTLPGQFQLTLPEGYHFEVTHDRTGLRLTAPQAAHADTLPQVWVFGGSYTHGWSVNDAETYLWHVQEALLAYHILNFGVPGYGTLQSLLQFKARLGTSQKPEAVLLAYASFHHERNVSARSWRKTLAPYNRLGPLHHPFAEMTDAGELHIGHKRLDYRPFPFMDCSALSHKLEQDYNLWQLKNLQSRAVTEALIRQFARQCEAQAIPFALVILITDPVTEAMERFCEAQGIPTVNITVDTRLPQNTNLPHDSHPSARAHGQYAEQLTTFLRIFLQEK